MVSGGDGIERATKGRGICSDRRGRAVWCRTLCGYRAAAAGNYEHCQERQPASRQVKGDVALHRERKLGEGEKLSQRGTERGPKLPERISRLRI